jgi:large repetitive protein
MKYSTQIKQALFPSEDQLNNKANLRKTIKTFIFLLIAVLIILMSGELGNILAGSIPDSIEGSTESKRIAGPVRKLANAASVWGPMFNGETVYLSDLAPVSAKEGKPQDGNFRKSLSIEGNDVQKGLRVIAPSELVYRLDQNYISFQAEVGLDDASMSNGSVVFKVYADGTLLYDSGLVKGGTGFKQAFVNLLGKQELRLVVTDGGDGARFDIADWGNARLIRSAGTSAFAPRGMPARVTIPTHSHGPGETRGDHASVDAALAAKARAQGSQFEQPQSLVYAVAPEQLSQLGMWGPVVQWPFAFATAASLPDGRILALGGNHQYYFDGGGNTFAAVWNPATGGFTPVDHNDHSMFCGIPNLLEDGRVFVTGGDGTRERVSSFDFRNNQWTRHEDMNEYRWYPGSVFLPSGKVFTMLGDPGGIYPEIWTEGQGWKLLTGANLNTPIINFPGYQNTWLPYIYLAPDGRLFHIGPTQRMNWLTYENNGSVASAGINNTWYPKYAGAVMYDQGKILVAGGQQDGDNLGATNQAMVIDLNGGTPSKRLTNPMTTARKYNNAIVLPNGEVLMVGGNTSGIEFSDEGTILAPEIWNPQTETWRRLAEMDVPRNYHSVALLMPDGRVWAGGGGLCGCAGDHPDHQIFTPPYLYTPEGTLAARPAINAAPAASSVGRSITVDASGGVAYFSLIKMSGLTHNLNSDLRYLRPAFTAAGGTQFNVTLPGNVNVLTPGYWMLFAVNGAGVPSVAKVIQIVTSTGPVLPALPARTNLLGETVSASVAAGSPSGAPLVYTATGLPTGLAIGQANGVIAGTLAAAGNFRVTITASDGAATATGSFDWTVLDGSQIADTFPTFADVSKIQLNGAAAKSGDMLRLTPAQGYLQGTAFYKTPIPITASTFISTRFQFRMSPNAGGADGMTFIIQGNAPTTLSPTGVGGGLGYAGIGKSIAIELDAYQGPGDPNENHIAALASGNIEGHLAVYNPPGSLKDGTIRTLWVDYSGVTNTVQVYLASGATAAKPAAPVLIAPNLNLATLVGGQAYLGFGAGTGGLVNNHDILAWDFTVGYGGANNNPPVLAAIGNRTNGVGGPVSLPLAATDPDGDPLLFSATGLPAGLTINQTTGAITGIPTTQQAYTVTATVSDGRGGLDSETFAWTITAGGVTLAPIVSPPKTVNESITYTAVAITGANPRFKWLFGDDTPETGYSATPTITHAFTQPGIYVVTLTAIDETGVEKSVLFTQAVHLPFTPHRASVSSNIVYEKRGAGADRVWAVNQDNDTVSVFDAVANVKVAEIAVGSRPRSVAVASNGLIWVTNKRSATISIIDPNTLAVVDTITLPYGSQPFGVVTNAPIGSAFVALEATGKLLKYDTSTRIFAGSVDIGPNVRNLSISGDGSRVYASRYITPPVPGEGTATPQPNLGGGEIVMVDGNALTTLGTIRLRHSNNPDTENSGRGIPNYLGGTAISPDGVNAWTPSKQDNIARGTLRDGRGLTFDSTVRSITSNIDLAASSENYDARIDHNNAGIASAAIFDRSGNYLFVAAEGSREVIVVDSYGKREIFHIPVGRAPQGLALSEDGLKLYVSNFTDRTVSAIDISRVVNEGAKIAPTIATYNSVAVESLSAQALIGKQFFYDALDPRLAREAYISCAACHNDGGHDGRTWDFTGFGEGLRNTISLEGRAGGQGFQHWSGNFDEIHDFEGQLRNLDAGTGLMTDAQFNTGTRSQPLGDPKAGVSADLDALAAYVFSLNVFPQSPYRTGGALTPDAVEGKALFTTFKCAECHGGDGFTFSGAGNLVNIGTIKPSSGGRLGGPLPGIDIPTLRDVWATAPYLHDGSAATLGEAILAHNGMAISPVDLGKLVAYMQQIGGEEPAVVPTGVAMFSFSDFSDLSRIQLNGSSAKEGAALRLTQAATYLQGTAFYKTPIQINPDTSFSTRFQARMAPGNGADGMTFMIQGIGATALSGTGVGEGLGYQGIAQSLAVELDTFQSPGDPDANHIGVLMNGNVQTHFGVYTPPVELDNGDLVNVWVDYDGAANTLSVFLTRGAATVKPAAPVLIVPNLDLAAIVGPQGFAGFSGATGGLVNTHDVLNWEFASTGSAGAGTFTSETGHPLTGPVVVGIAGEAAPTSAGLKRTPSVTGSTTNGNTSVQSTETAPSSKTQPKLQSRKVERKQVLRYN